MAAAEGAGAATRWPFYVAMSLFRGAAILAGVRARAAAGNASAANAHAAGTLVVSGEQVVLVVTGRDACENTDRAEVDPTEECAYVLPNGECCRVLEPPEGEECPVPPCGT